MNVDRRWLWAGGILAVAGGAVALGVPLATLITLAAVLACPAAMYLGMGMMGRMQRSEHTGGSPSSGGGGAGTAKLVPLAPPGTAAAPSRDAPPADDDPVLILKRRLASGDISLDEYDRLLTVVSRPDSDRAGQRSST